MAQPDTVLRKIRDAVGARASETAQRNAVMAVLGEYGMAGSLHPQDTRMGRVSTGGAFRIYMWTGTPAGDFALITGPTVEAEVKKLADIEVEAPPGRAKGPYVALGEVDERFRGKVQDASTRVQGRLEAARMRQVAGDAAAGRARAVERPAAPRPRATPAPVEVPLEEVVVQQAPAAWSPDFVIEWAEGPVGSVVEGMHVQTVLALDAILGSMARVSPEGGTYHKVKIHVTKPDGTRTWTRVDLTRDLAKGDQRIMEREHPSWAGWLAELREDQLRHVPALDHEAARKVQNAVERLLFPEDTRKDGRGDVLLHKLVDLKEKAQKLLKVLKAPPQDKSPQAWTGAALRLVQERQDLEPQYADILDPQGTHYDQHAARGWREVNDLINSAAQRAMDYANLVTDGTEFPGRVEVKVREFMDAEEAHQQEEGVSSWQDEVERLQEVIKHFKRTVVPDVISEGRVLVQKAKSFGMDWQGLVNAADEQVRMWGVAPLQKLLQEAQDEAAKEAARSKEAPRSSEAIRADQKQNELADQAEARKRTVHVFRHDGRDTVREFVDEEQARQFVAKMVDRDRGIGSVKKMELIGGGTTIAYDPDGKLIRGKGLHPSHTDQAFTDTTKTLAGTFVPAFDPKGNPEGGPYLVHTRSGRWQVMLGTSPISPEQDLERSQELAIRTWRQDRQKTVGPAALIVWDAGGRDGEGAFHRLGEYLSGAVPMRDPETMKAQQEAQEEAERTEGQRTRAKTYSYEVSTHLDHFDALGAKGDRAARAGAFNQARELMEILRGVNLRAYLDPKLDERYEGARKAWEAQVHEESRQADDQAMLRRTTGNFLKQAQSLLQQAYNVGQAMTSDLPPLQMEAAELLEGIHKWQRLLDERVTDPEDRRELGQRAQEAANLALNAKTKIDEEAAKRKAVTPSRAVPEADTAQAAQAVEQVEAIMAKRKAAGFKDAQVRDAMPRHLTPATLAAIKSQLEARGYKVRITSSAPDLAAGFTDMIVSQPTPEAPAPAASSDDAMMAKFTAALKAALAEE